MKFLIMKMIMVFCSFSCFMKNPLSMGLLLMFYSFMISILMSKIMLTSWFCIILMLMMIGGLLVIFMYISSISSNEKFKLNNFMLFYFIILVIYLDEFLMENHSFDSIFMNLEIDFSESISVVKLYNESSMMLTILMIIYLIFTMLVVSYIVKHYKGPLRSMNYE
uniref:NADH dehydrogenase subunit 6 n=1 Tax=Midoria longicornis TaxID=3133673 RepID=A0AAU6PC51_9HEMI